MNSLPPATCSLGIDLQTADAQSRPGAAARPAAPLWPALLVVAGIVCLLTAGVLLLQGALRPAEFRIGEPANHAAREAGFALYRANCAACHGAFLGGAPGWRADARLAPALDESGHAPNHSDTELFRRVAAGSRTPDGRAVMPAFRGVLSDAEIVSVLAYVQSWWPEDELRRRAGADWRFAGICSPAETGAAAPPKAGL